MRGSPTCTSRSTWSNIPQFRSGWPIVEEALALDPLPKVIWMQLGVRNDLAAAKAEAKGVTVIMNRCPKIEYARLSGEIGRNGVNSRILSSKKPRLMRGFRNSRSIGNSRQIGSGMPFLLTVTRAEVSVPSGCLAAVISTSAPGCRSVFSAGA